MKCDAHVPETSKWQIGSHVGSEKMASEYASGKLLHQLISGDR